MPLRPVTAKPPPSYSRSSTTSYGRSLLHAWPRRLPVVKEYSSRLGALPVADKHPADRHHFPVRFVPVATALRSLHLALAAAIPGDGSSAEALPLGDRLAWLG
jgi:hypothetical protein